MDCNKLHTLLQFSIQPAPWQFCIHVLHFKSSPDTEIISISPCGCCVLQTCKVSALHLCSFSFALSLKARDVPPSHVFAGLSAARAFALLNHV